MKGQYIIIAFTCAQCGQKLEAHVDATPGFSAGFHTAKCPKCGLEQGNGSSSFPARVLRTIVVGDDMIEDVEYKGKHYRIIAERANIDHPENAIVMVVQLKKPKGHTEVWKETAANDQELEHLVRDARAFVNGL